MDHRIRKARDHFGIQKPDDWQRIRPEWIQGIDGVGPRTLDLLRLYLAGRGLTLQDDATPEFWQRNIQTASVGGQVSLIDNVKTEAFTVLIDAQEKQPWTFQGFPTIVPIKYQSLGPSHGDYTIAGYERSVHIERKSKADAQGTFTAPPDTERGERWRATLNFLAEIPCGAVVIECTMGEMLADIESRGKRSVATLRKVMHRQVLAWQCDFALPFIFCDHRRLAEASALQIMRRHWRAESGLRKRKSKPTIDEQIASLT